MDKPKVKLSLDLDHLFNKAIWAILVGLVAFGVKKASDISDNIASLNEKMAVVITTVGEDKETLKDHEVRLRDLEHKKTHMPLGN